jgi:hypothetical protein
MELHADEKTGTTTALLAGLAEQPPPPLPAASRSNACMLSVAQ